MDVAVSSLPLLAGGFTLTWLADKRRKSAHLKRKEKRKSLPRFTSGKVEKFYKGISKRQRPRLSRNKVKLLKKHIGTFVEGNQATLVTIFSNLKKNVNKIDVQEPIQNEKIMEEDMIKSNDCNWSQADNKKPVQNEEDLDTIDVQEPVQNEEIMEEEMIKSMVMTNFSGCNDDCNCSQSDAHSADSGLATSEDLAKLSENDAKQPEAMCEENQDGDNGVDFETSIHYTSVTFRETSGSSNASDSIFEESILGNKKADANFEMFQNSTPITIPSQKREFVSKMQLSKINTRKRPGARKLDEPNNNTNLQVKDTDVSMTPCGTCKGCNVTEDCATRCENCVQNYIQTEIENNANPNILPCLKRMCHEKHIPKKKRLKYPLLHVNKMLIGARNVTVKISDGKEEMGVSDEEKVECNKGANNNNKVLRSTFKESTATNSSSTTENASGSNCCTPENNGYKPNAENSPMKSNAMNVRNNTLCQLNSVAFSSLHQSNIKVAVRVDKPDSELQIIDMPKLNETSGNKSEALKLVDSNMYRTCACLELCHADSCACVGYLEECSESCQCGDSCSNTGLTVGEEKKLFLATSDVHGTGCFTDEDIKEGDFVGEYVGEIVSKVDAAKKRNPSKFLFMTGDKKFVIDASRCGSKLTRMNHQDEKSGGNCEFKLKRVRGAWRVGVWALQDISKGVELFANYGKHYWI